MSRWQRVKQTIVCKLRHSGVEEEVSEDVSPRRVTTRRSTARCLTCGRRLW